MCPIIIQLHYDCTVCSVRVEDGLQNHLLGGTKEPQSNVTGPCVILEVRDHDKFFIILDNPFEIGGMEKTKWQCGAQKKIVEKGKQYILYFSPSLFLNIVNHEYAHFYIKVRGLGEVVSISGHSESFARCSLPFGNPIEAIKPPY